MTHKRAWASILAIAWTVSGAAAQNLSNAEKQPALRYLSETRQGLSEAVNGLSAEQRNFKPGPDRWSVAEVVEHLAVVEDVLTQNILGKLETGAAAAPGRDYQEVDAMILTRVPDRSGKFQAPPAIAPTGRWAPRIALAHFLEARARTVSALESMADLRRHVIPHPALGLLDGYQWILAAAAHTERHTKQILEVRRTPIFRQSRRTRGEPDAIFTFDL